MRRIGFVLLCVLLTSCSTNRLVMAQPVAADSSIVAGNPGATNDGVLSDSLAEARDLYRSPAPANEMDEIHGESTYRVLLVITTVVVAIYAAVTTFIQSTQ